MEKKVEIGFFAFGSTQGRGPVRQYCLLLAAWLHFSPGAGPAGDGELHWGNRQNMGLNWQLRFWSSWGDTPCAGTALPKGVGTGGHGEALPGMVVWQGDASLASLLK